MNDEKQDFKKQWRHSGSTFHASFHSSKITQKCPVDGCNHRISKCEKFEAISFEELHNKAKEKNFCFFLSWRKHAAKECQRAHKCGIDNCEKKQNRMLHHKTKITVAEKPNESTNLTSNLESVLVLMQIASRVFGGEGRFEDTLAACDTGSNQAWIDEELPNKLKFNGETISFNVTGIHGTELTTCKKVQASIGREN